MTTRPIAIALAALGLIALALPGRAIAGCNHGGLASHEPAAALTRLSLLDDGPRDWPANRPCPCTGPSCSGRSSTPLPAPTVAHPERIDRWTCLLRHTQPLDSLSETLLFDPIACRPVLVGQRLDRPPRVHSRFPLDRARVGG